MSRTLLVLFGFALSGAAGAAVAVLATHDTGTGMEAPPGLARVEARVSDVETQVASIRDAVRALRTPPPAPVATAPAPLAAGVPSSDAADPTAPALTDEKLDEKVREAVEKEQDAQREAIGRRFAAMAEQREMGLLDRLAEEAGLSAWQRTEMEKILAKRREAIGSFFRVMFGGGGDTTDMGDFREKIRAIRQESDEAVKQVLSPDQYETWTKEDAATRRGPMFGGPGGGFGGGGGR